MDDVLAAARRLADDWRRERSDRLRRDRLDESDFAAIAKTGYYRLAVPEAQDGSWRSVARSTREICDVLRVLAAGDPSPALVAAMHPAVLAFWLATEDVSQPAWEAQRRAVFATARVGGRWGTVTSEPGSGGDVAHTRARAVAAEDGAVDVDVPGARHRITGDKHFGSGTGICSFMVTTAVPEGEDEPAAFFIDTRPIAARGSDGLAGMPGFTIVAPWEGAGMAATQSHGARLEGCPAVRLAWSGKLDALVAGAAPVNLALFTAVILGVVDEAMATAKERLAPKAASLRAYEQVEWSRASVEHWLAGEAYEGMLRAIERDSPREARRAGLHGKVAVADLAETILGRIARVVGGGSFSRSSPFAAWHEDVRALGFLRPPWGLTFDGVFSLAFD